MQTLLLITYIESGAIIDCDMQYMHVGKKAQELPDAINNI